MAKGQRTIYVALRMFRQAGRVYQEGDRVTTIDAKLINFYLDGAYVKKVVERIETAQNDSNKNQLTIPDGDIKEPSKPRRKPARRTGGSKPRKPAARKQK